MWSTYSGYTGVRRIETNLSAVSSGFFASTSFYSQPDPPSTISSSTSFYFTDFENFASVTINNGSITYLDSDENEVISALNISSYLQTTKSITSNYALAVTTQTQFSRTIFTTYTEETTTSTDSLTKTLSITYTYTDLTQTTSLVAVSITTITDSGTSSPTVLVGFSNSDVTEYGDESVGVYMVVHPSIGYPWTSGDESMQFMQTFTYNSNLTGDTNIIQWVLGGTLSGGLVNIDAENKTAYPKTISQSFDTIMYANYWTYGEYPSSGGTVTALSEETSSLSYETLSSISTTAGAGSRYVYNSDTSGFSTIQSYSESVSSWYAVADALSFTNQQELTLFLSIDPGGENTWSDGDGLSQTYRYITRLQTQTTTGYKTQIYTHVNSGASGAYFNTFAFSGLALTTRTIRNAEFDGNSTSITNHFISTNSNAAEQFFSSEFSLSYVSPALDSVIKTIIRGLDVVEVNRIRAFSDYDIQPAVTTYIRSPNYNFAIGTDSTNGYLDIRHGGYVEKITPESLLTKCFWSIYKFERTANINVPVLAYPINTQSTNGSGTTTQSVQIPMEFFNGNDIASIYRTTLAGTSQTTTTHTCSYGAIEQYKSMILQSMTLNDISFDVAATAQDISAGIAKFELGQTLAIPDYVAINFLGKTHYVNQPPIRQTAGAAGNPNSAIGAQAIEDQNSFTLVRTTDAGFPFTFLPKPYLVSFSIMQ